MLPKASRLVARSKLFFGVLLIAPVSANAAVHEIAVVGPIEAMDCGSQSLRILGVRFAANTVASANLCELGAFPVSSYVSAIGRVDPTGQVQLYKLALVPNTLYVPGASLVYIRGEVSKANISTGEISLTGARIDSQLASTNIGSIVEVVGTQPLPNGAVLSLSLRVINDTTTKDSSVGSGSEVISSVGSGASLMSSVGSGVAQTSSVGSGSVAFSSVGSGASIMSSVGSGVAQTSSVGPGNVAFSSVGSGASLMSSVGSGFARTSSVGSGSEAISSVGSGASLISSVGSGVALMSSVGSGVAKSSSVDSGATLISSVGSGAE